MIFRSVVHLKTATFFVRPLLCVQPCRLCLKLTELSSYEYKLVQTPLVLYKHMSSRNSSGSRRSGGTKNSNNNDDGNIKQDSMKPLRTVEFLGWRPRLGQKSNKTSTEIKVMNYNILSQDLLERHMYLYRNHLPHVLPWSYRSPLLLQEIVYHSPDILCLQEVEKSEFTDFFSQLETLGYRGIFKKKTHNKTDGCAIYFNTRKFELVEWTGVDYYRDHVQTLNRDNVGLLVRLKLKSNSSNNELIVATTHLLYNPRRSDVRVSQTQVLLAELDRMRRQRNPPLDVILTGDFNSLPESQVLKLLIRGWLYLRHSFLPPSLGITSECQYKDMVSPSQTSKPLPEVPPGLEDSLDGSCSNSPEDSCDPADRHIIRHDLNFSSVHSFYSFNDNEATTYQDEWVTVDYILFTVGQHLKLLSRVRLPTSDECSSFIKHIPNEFQPSDHLPVIATFNYQSN